MYTELNSSKRNSGGIYCVGIYCSPWSLHYAEQLRTIGTRSKTYRWIGFPWWIPFNDIQLPCLLSCLPIKRDSFLYSIAKAPGPFINENFSASWATVTFGRFTQHPVSSLFTAIQMRAYTLLRSDLLFLFLALARCLHLVVRVTDCTTFYQRFILFHPWMVLCNSARAHALSVIGKAPLTPLHCLLTQIYGCIYYPRWLCHQRCVASAVARIFPSLWLCLSTLWYLTLAQPPPSSTPPFYFTQFSWDTTHFDVSCALGKF